MRVKKSLDTCPACHGRGSSVMVIVFGQGPIADPCVCCKGNGKVIDWRLALVEICPDLNVMLESDWPFQMIFCQKCESKVIRNAFYNEKKKLCGGCDLNIK